MRKGFFLTESEKNRISNLYGGNKLFLLEATAPMPTDTPTQIKFADWMDQKHPNWITKNDGTKVNSTNTKIRRNNTWANSNSFKTAWNRYGDDFIKENEKGTTSGGNVTVTQKKEWFYYKDEKPVGPKTKDELLQLVSSGDINGDTYVFAQGITTAPTKASNVTDLGIPPKSSEIKYNPPENWTGTQTSKNATRGDQYFSSMTSETRTELSEPKSNIDRQYTDEGFVEWAKNTLKQKIDIKMVDLDPKGNMVRVTLPDNNVMTYYYDQNKQEWDIPDYSNRLKITRPKQTP
jgi:hypothetical protein